MKGNVQMCIWDNSILYSITMINVVLILSEGTFKIVPSN